MRVCGIDYSTKAIDLVSLDFDSNDPVWRHIDLAGTDLGSFRAALRVKPRMAHMGSFWEDVSTVYLEQPFSHSRATLYSLGMIAGGILAMLPKHVREDGAVSQISAPQWRNKLLGDGNANKNDVQDYLSQIRGFTLPMLRLKNAPLDAWEALGIAVVARDEIHAHVGTA